MSNKTAQDLSTLTVIGDIDGAEGIANLGAECSNVLEQLYENVARTMMGAASPEAQGEASGLLACWLMRVMDGYGLYLAGGGLIKG